MYRKIFIVVFILVGITLILKIRNKIVQKREEEKEQKQVNLMDRMLKPAEISIKFVSEPIKEAIQAYIVALYNNSIEMLPSSCMTEKCYTEVSKDISRFNDMRIKRELLNYSPEDIRIKQNNSSIYTVSELIVTAKYSLEFFSEHPTFKKKTAKTISQTFIFMGTNDKGWQLNEIGKEIIINCNEEDLY